MTSPSPSGPADTAEQVESDKDPASVDVTQISQSAMPTEGDELEERSKHLRFYQYTCGSMLEKYFIQCHPLWGAPLERNEYVRQQASLIKEENETMDSAVVCVMHFEDDLDSFLCGCMTYLRSVIISSDQGPRQAWALVIRNMFTPPEYRGRGFAKELTKCIAIEMDKTEKLEYPVELTVVYPTRQPNLFERLG